jgi:hypothetical protein
VVFANQRGPRALDLVKSCSELDLSFWKGKSIVPADPDLPPTGEILTSLKNGAITRPNGADPHYTSAPAAPAVNKPQKPVETERSPLPSAGSDTPLPAPAALRVILETELTRSIGPVAAVYIERYASQINSVRNHHQLTQLLRVLAGKAASPQTASEFFERVLVNLRSP